jgi:cyclohexanecarboxylate-CoA ligase
MSAPARNPDLARSYRERGHWLGRSLWTELVSCCDRLGERDAIVDGAVRLGFGDVRRYAEHVGAALADLGVGFGTPVCFQLPNWWETVVVYWALARLGAVANPVLPIHRLRELRFIVREARAEVLIVPGVFRGFDHRELANQLRGDSETLRHVIVVRDEPRNEQIAFPEVPPSPLFPSRHSSRVSGSDPFLLMYTSGTTADPKGVVHTHDTLGYELRSLAAVHGLGETDTVLMPSPLTHISGLIHAVLAPFLLGSRAVLMDGWEPGRALEIIERESVTYMVGAPVFLSDLTFHPDLARRSIRTLRLFSCGGAPVTADLIRESRNRLGCVAKRVYGSTEYPTLTTTSADDAPERGATTEGRVIGAAELRIVDEDGNAVPSGCDGEVQARGPECFVGYRDPTLNRDAFTADGWFRTGDVGVVDEEGYLTVRGRKKDIIIRKGEKISAAELESLIARHPAVSDVAVVGLPDPLTGERACACIIVRPGCELVLEDLCAFVLTQGIARQKLPEALRIVDALPRTATGKIQKQQLREALARSR